MRPFILSAIGFSGGLVVGGAIATFFTALGIITRIIELVKTKRDLILYKLCILTGTMLSTYTYIFELKAKLNGYILIIIGLFMGIFVGMVASALAEVLNVIPLVAGALNIGKWIYIIIFIMIMGKIIGSILYWIIPGFY